MVGSWFLDFQVLSILVTWIVGVIILLGVTFLGFLSASWDLLRNQWIEDMSFSRWNLFTTRHYSTWLFHRDEKLWFRQFAFFCLPASVSIASLIFDTLAGIGSTFLNIIISTIILLAEWYRKA